MKILAIETSCDESSVSIIDIHQANNAQGPEIQILSHLTQSQIEMHREYGGVYPTIAKREHAKNLLPLIHQSLEESKLFNPGETIFDPEKIETILKREPEAQQQLKKLLNETEKPHIDYIAVTQGPGLEPALWVGINVAKALGEAWGVPVIPVNHMEGHILSVLIQKESSHISLPPFPALAFLISGGHTELVLAKKIGDYKILGQTRDDAVGEAFDKVARLLGLPYPGGPEISRLGEQGNKNKEIALPRPMIHSDDYDFSFSGLKTAVRYLIEELGGVSLLSEQTKADIAREFEQAVVDVLIAKAKKVLKEHDISSLILGGGVSANKKIRSDIAKMITDEFSNVVLFVPNTELTGDNALMIALVAYFKISEQKEIPIDFVANGNLLL